ncbi:glycoside hydrolase family 25 protein [Telmatospirillum siberiense]|uniref:1,4-beta-N-acetylmuramidase n=1 Tax=Telmatospirillum siberiense TaxID=382514 RepID=A0A2N3PTT3_9PROT|nr:glycoside hydrolase family 25 protein [Telmatospirillum siberiense]PKU23803.1 1,4-beta-N-acetylmuramidase [Telmatospirillum siberiense]
MLTRRLVLAGLLSLAAAPMASAANRPRKAAAKSPTKLDAVIDISHLVDVSDFHLARKKSNILGVIHKASEGGDFRDPLYAKRRVQAEAAGLLWGAYHYGTHQYSGAEQAKMFLTAAKPGPDTLMALDLEFNDSNPANTMQLRQAEDFVHAVFAATGRRPLIYTSSAWADGKPAAGSGRCLGGGGVGERSILAQCPLWLADYRSTPELPRAWRGKGWHFWQYAGDTEQGGPRGKRVRGVWGIDRCDRNMFRGDAAALIHFWKKDGGRSVIS